MQIIPPTSSGKNATVDTLFGSQATSTEERASFADELTRHQEAQQAVDEGQAHSVQAALAQDTSPKVELAPLTTAPYSRNTTDGVTYTTDEVCFTKQELQELQKKLELAGAPAESLKDFKKLVEQPDGATLAQVLASLHQLRDAPKLTEDEIGIIKNLAGKIDSTGALGDTIMEHINAGNGKKALDALAAAMGNLPPGTRVAVEKSEVAVLGKALGLSNDAQKQLQANFGPYPSVQLNKTDFDKFIAPAANDFAKEENNKKKLDKALDATLAPILKKAKDRITAEKAATELSNKRTEQSKTLIQKTVLEKVNDTLEGTRQNLNPEQEELATRKTAAEGNKTQAGQEMAQQAQAGTGKQEATPLGKETKGQHNVTAADATAQAAQSALQAAKQGQNSQTQNGQEHGAGQKDARDAKDVKDAKDARDAKETRKGDGWEDLLGKTESRTAAAAPATGQVTTPVIGFNTAAPQGVVMPQSGTSAAPLSPISRQALSQVEQSMLTALNDGTKRLELQLNPVELGSLTLMLTTRNGEVSATIRSERGETADMINRQLDVLRTTLEQQGIKVDKLEVQTQSPENNAQQEQWQSMQQHNARQEENARRETLDRLRMLGKMRNSSENSDGILLEQGMQSVHYTAGNAAQSLHIVA